MFKLTINTDNAAFEGEDRDAEIARILHHIGERLSRGTTQGRAIDSNGNTVGEFGCDD